MCEKASHLHWDFYVQRIEGLWLGVSSGKRHWIITKQDLVSEALCNCCQCGHPLLDNVLYGFKLFICQVHNLEDSCKKFILLFR